MDAMKKPPLKKPHVYIKFSVCFVLIFAYVLLMFFAFYNAHRYTVAVPLELEAEIVRVEYVSSEASGSYNAIMRYAHNGVNYETVYENFSREDKAQATIGQKVIAVVDAAHPEDALMDLHNLTMTLLMLAGVTIFLLVFAPTVPHRETYVETYGWCVDAIRKDILLLPKYGVVRMLIWVVGCMIMYWLYPGVFERITVIFALYLIVGTIMGLTGFFLFARDYWLLISGKIKFRRDTYVSKFTRSDGDGGTNYFVNFNNGETLWEKSVSAAVYEKMKEGDEVESAYLGKQKKPILSIRHNEDVI